MTSKKLIVFDLDGTLTEVKSMIDTETCDLLAQLLSQKQVAIISGESYVYFKEHILGGLETTIPRSLLKKLCLFPASSSLCYCYRDGWSLVYEEALLPHERSQIKDSFGKISRKLAVIRPDKIYGDEFEDSGAQITFLGLGQQAPVELRKRWDPDRRKRTAIRNALLEHLPEFNLSVAGTISIDITNNIIKRNLPMFF